MTPLAVSVIVVIWHAACAMLDVYGYASFVFAFYFFHILTLVEDIVKPIHFDVVPYIGGQQL